GVVQKATLHVAFDGSCGITGVAKTTTTSWFVNAPVQAVNPQMMVIPNLSEPGTIQLDSSSQRTFEFNSGLMQGEPTHDATADVTGWFPRSGATTFGVGFIRQKSGPCIATMWPITVEIEYYPSS
ncbi:MAG TPA: hypothetical protein VK216_06030, partial [Magnetospirillaceae bacterium]|nr:hypothetical protein [Magnetospirillaceae bacterium]